MFYKEGIVEVSVVIRIDSHRQVFTTAKVTQRLRRDKSTRAGRCGWRNNGDGGRWSCFCLSSYPAVLGECVELDCVMLSSSEELGGVNRSVCICNVFRSFVHTVCGHQHCQRHTRELPEETLWDSLREWHSQRDTMDGRFAKHVFVGIL
jgi:hypothetical protein